MARTSTSRPVLVTGAGGFIGGHVCRAFKRAGIAFVPFAGDVTRSRDFAEYEECGPVLHLAGKTTRENSLTPETRRMLDVNVLGTYNAVSFAARGGRPLFFASSCGYEPGAPMPASEDARVAHGNVYGFSKYLGEELVLGWARYFGLRGAVVRVFNPYGPGQPKGFVIPDLAAQLDGDAVVARDTESVRDFLYVEDLADFFTRLVSRNLDSMAVLNAGTGTGHSIAQVLKIMFELTGRNLLVEDRCMAPAIPVSVADVSRARELLDWKAKTSLRQGLAAVLAQQGLIPMGG